MFLLDSFLSVRAGERHGRRVAIVARDAVAVRHEGRLSLGLHFFVHFFQCPSDA